MAKTKISEFSATPANNTDIDSINIAEGCAPSGINDAIRELMAQLKDFQTGARGDSFNGPVGTSTAAAGAFTNLTASGTLGVTGVATLGAGAILNTPASVTLTNATGLPIATGVSGLGTGIATALAVNTGSAGAPVLFNGALGTPSSGTVTNLTGTASININGTVGATTATTGAFTTLTTSSTVTLNGGTANGVAYLNGSKVLTTGSALTFDGSLLNTTGSIRAQTSLFVYGAGDRLNVFPQAAGSGVQLLVTNNANSAYAPLTLDGSATIFNVSGGEIGRFTSTGLGIGTSSPGAKLESSVTSAGATAEVLRLSNPGAGANTQAQIKFFTTSTNYGTISGGYGAGAPQMTFDLPNGTAGNYVWQISSTERMRLDSSGNLGLGVTPSAWGGKAFQIGNASNSGWASIGYDANGKGFFATSAYNDTGSAWKYTATGLAATLYSADFGTHKWFTAASGTAGNAISFTQAMTLDASGNLRVGATSPSSFGKLAVAGNAALNTNGQLKFYNSANNNWSFIDNPSTDGTAFLRFATGGGEAARITSSNNFLVGTTGNGSPGLGVANSLNISFPESTNGTSLATMFRQSSSGDLVLGSGVRYSATADAFASSTGDAWARTAINVGYGAIKFFTAAEATVSVGTNTTLTERARIDSSGNLLVGATSGSQKLFVVSTASANAATAIKCANDGAGTYYLNTSGTADYSAAVFLTAGGSTQVGSIVAGATTTTYNITSDQRLKENIQDAASTSDLIDAIQVRQYDWKSDGSHQRYGFIAQELMTVAPEAVHQPADPEAMMAVDYSKLVPMLVKEIQSLRARLAAANI